MIRTPDSPPHPVLRPLAALVALLLLATACSSNPNGEAGDYADLAGTCEPKMEEALQGWVDEGFAGSIAVLGDERPCAVGLGVADRETDRAVTAETAFSIGSVTKAVTAAAILHLADQGLVDLDDTAGDYVDGLTDGVDGLKIRNLLVHTSGLTGYHGQDHVALSKPEAVAAISDLGLSFDQGTEYSYTNAGYTLLALVVEEVTDQGYRRFLTDEILVDGNGDPIGGFWDGEPAAPEPRAVGYLAGNEPGELGDFAGPHWALDGNGGVAMTALQMAEWTRALFSGEILSEDATELLTTIRKRHSSGEYELPGWVELPAAEFGERVILASGGGGSIGHLMDVVWFPDTERVVAVAQSATSYNTNDLLRHIADALATGTGVPTPPALLTTDAATLDRFVGTYRLDDEAGGGEIRIDIDDLDPRGLRVEAEGPGAVSIIFPLPAGFEGEIERHEANALKLANGETAEGASLRADFEAEAGEITGVSIIASIFDGELITFLDLRLQDGNRTMALALNEQGGSEFIALDVPPPNRWFVYQDDGSFVMHRPSEMDPEVRLLLSEEASGASSGGDLQIDGPGGTFVATRVG